MEQLTTNCLCQLRETRNDTFPRGNCELLSKETMIKVIEAIENTCSLSTQRSLQKEAFNLNGTNGARTKYTLVLHGSDNKTQKNIPQRTSSQRNDDQSLYSLETILVRNMQKY